MEHIITVDVCCTNEHAEYPIKAAITLDKKQVARIRKLAKTVKRLKVYCIEEFDYTPEWQDDEGNESDCRIDCAMLKVTDDSFQWRAYLKHVDNAELSTDSIGLDVLDAMDCPVEDLPKLITSENELIKEIATARLKEEK